MRKYKLSFTPETAKLLAKLHPETKKTIKSTLKEIRETLFSGYDLQEELSGLKAFRSKRYRIIYRINEADQAIEILHVGHRRDVYEQFRRLLSQMR